jgi:hypothetical protein
MSRGPKWRPNHTITKNLRFQNFACLPSVYLTGTAKAATTAFYTLLSQHPSVPSTGKKEQEFWNKAKLEEPDWIVELMKYARRYGFHTWEWKGAVPIDTSPLYWRLVAILTAATLTFIARLLRLFLTLEM